MTFWTATGYCVHCLITTAGVGEETRRVAEQTGDTHALELKIIDVLRRDARTRPIDPTV